MKTYASKSVRHVLTALAAATLLVACGGGGDSGSDRDVAVTIDTSGRLALTEKDSKALRIHDLDSNTVQATHQLDNVTATLYASPGGRYALAVQRLQDQVQFVDAGVWQEDHVDHLHDYKEASKMVSFKLTGSRPTHYDVQVGKQAAFFMDGDATAAPVKNAGVRLITEASIASGQVVASMDLTAPVHGLGEPVDNKLLTVSRATDAADTLPTHLNLYQRSGSGYTFDRHPPAGHALQWHAWQLLFGQLHRGRLFRRGALGQTHKRHRRDRPEGDHAAACGNAGWPPQIAGAVHWRGQRRCGTRAGHHPLLRHQR
jgi:hypothetical protein